MMLYCGLRLLHNLVDLVVVLWLIAKGVHLFRTEFKFKIFINLDSLTLPTPILE